MSSLHHRNVLKTVTYSKVPAKCWMVEGINILKSLKRNVTWRKVLCQCTACNCWENTVFDVFSSFNLLRLRNIRNLSNIFAPTCGLTKKSMWQELLWIVNVMHWHCHGSKNFFAENNCWATMKFIEAMNVVQQKGISRTEWWTSYNYFVWTTRKYNV